MQHGVANEPRHSTLWQCSEIVQTLRQLGLQVWVVNDLADLVVQYGSATAICEVRPPNKPRKPRKGPQMAFHDTFNVYWLQTTEDCMTLLKWLKSAHQVVGFTEGSGWFKD